MKIYLSKFKNVQSVCVETANSIAHFLPTEGGKMASFKAFSKEYLVQNPSKEFLHLGLEGSFEKTECAGFDDMFPTIDPVTIKDGDRAGKTYPDHGEVARLSFDYQINEDSLVMETISKELNYAYKKTITEENGALKIDYQIENLSNEVFPCVWAGHCLIDISGGGKVITPFSEGDLVDLVNDVKGKFGKKGERLPLKEQMLTFDKTPDGHCYKLYFPQKLLGGKVAFNYADGKTFTMQFSDGLTYLGLWLNHGFLNDCSCIGLEPCTAGYDTVYNAEKYGQKGEIRANGKLNFSLILSVE